MLRKTKAILGVVWLLTASMLLSSCAKDGIPISENNIAMTLPPPVSQHVPPIGDANLEYQAEVTLFLPKHDGIHLTSFSEEVAFSVTRPQAESVVQALLSHEGSGVAATLGGEVRLSMFGVNPVEVSRDVATVNLAASALQLDRKSYYMACQAITNTLTRLPGIHYVNFLVMDRQVGLDIAGTLPAGAFTRSIGEDIGAVYEQLLSQRAGSSESAEVQSLSRMVTLYFPLAGMDGLLPEARSVSFESQDLSDMTLRLLQELGAGSQQIADSPALPLLSDILNRPPSITEASEGGGHLITLHFAPDLDDMLAAAGLARAGAMASLCYTLTTFLPNIAGIRVYIGNELVQNVRLADTAEQPALLFGDALQQRQSFAPFLMDWCVLYLAHPNGQKLMPVQRAIPYYQTTTPRALLLELAKGPLPTDHAKNALPIMGKGALVDSDVLGFSLAGDTLLIHFAQSFDQVGKGMTPAGDRLLAYGLTNTLCALSRIRRVCFFVAGNPPEDFSGEIYWAGDFFKNMGVVQSGE